MIESLFLLLHYLILLGGFWDFTWDEMAHYDLPTMIEKALEVTGESELFYAGHSMGTTAFMAMHHYRPDIGQKL